MGLVSNFHRRTHMVNTTKDAMREFAARSPHFHTALSVWVKMLLRQGQLEQAACLLAEVVAECNLDCEIEVISLQSQLQRLEAQRIQGVVTLQEYGIERNRILVLLYCLLKKI